MVSRLARRVGKTAYWQLLMAKHRLKHVAEYVLLRGAIGCFGILPYRAALLIGWVIARLSYCLLRRKVQEAKRRVRLVLGVKRSDTELARISWISWRNTIFNLVESLRMPSIRAFW